MSWLASRMMVVANSFQGDAENPQAHVVLHTPLESTWFDGAVHVGLVGADRRVRPLGLTACDENANLQCTIVTIRRRLAGGHIGHWFQLNRGRRSSWRPV